MAFKGFLQPDELKDILNDLISKIKNKFLGRILNTTDFGTTLPTNLATNQIFFQKADLTQYQLPVGIAALFPNGYDPNTLIGGTWTKTGSINATATSGGTITYYIWQRSALS